MGETSGRATEEGSLSQDGQTCKTRGSMTSWRCLTPLFLCVFLGTILQSEAGCWDLFKPKNWNDELGQTYGIKNTSDVKDMMKCSAGQICHDTREKMCSVITSCYVQEDATAISAECQTASVSLHVSHYDFMCLIAKDLGFDPPHGFCQYEAVLELSSKIAANPSSAESVKLGGSGRDSVTLKGFLLVSVALNVLLPLLVFLFMRRRQRPSPWDNEALPGLGLGPGLGPGLGLDLHGNAEGNSARARVEITSEASEKNSPRSPKRSDRESRLELLPNINMGNDAVGEETKA